MRSLEIRTQRIFNNLIKQNQKLASDFVLKQSTIVSSAQRPASRVQSPVSRVQSTASRVQRPVSRVQHPESRVQSPAPNSCVWSPEIPVCHLNLMYNTSTPWNQQLARYVFSKVIECLEQNIRKQIDCKRPSKRFQKINWVQNIEIEMRKYKAVKWFEI